MHSAHPRCRGLGRRGAAPHRDGLLPRPKPRGGCRSLLCGEVLCSLQPGARHARGRGKVALCGGLPGARAPPHAHAVAVARPEAPQRGPRRRWPREAPGLWPWAPGRLRAQRRVELRRPSGHRRLGGAGDLPQPALHLPLRLLLPRRAALGHAHGRRRRQQPPAPDAPGEPRPQLLSPALQRAGPPPRLPEAPAAASRARGWRCRGARPRLEPHLRAAQAARGPLRPPRTPVLGRGWAAGCRHRRGRGRGLGEVSARSARVGRAGVRHPVPHSGPHGSSGCSGCSGRRSSACRTRRPHDGGTCGAWGSSAAATLV
mmetsp:Transcript_85756/g.227904  ORF Transcript_85756/g.227904 Transcript_85756/m.227904 type:complete len:315 (+) Transcript_85756:2518-3462(+)